MLGQKIKIPVGGDFEPLPEDKYTALIVDVSLVTQFNTYKGENQELLNYKFAVLDDKPMPEKIGASPASVRGRFLWRRCSKSLNKKSWLYKLASGQLGRDLTQKELEDFDPEGLVGKQVDVMVNQVRSDDGFKIFNNILSFSKTHKLLEPVEIKQKDALPGTTTQSVFVAPELEDTENLTLEEVLGEEPKENGKKKKVTDFPLS